MELGARFHWKQKNHGQVHGLLRPRLGRHAGYLSRFKLFHRYHFRPVQSSQKTDIKSSLSTRGQHQQLHRPTVPCHYRQKNSLGVREAARNETWSNDLTTFGMRFASTLAGRSLAAHFQCNLSASLSCANSAMPTEMTSHFSLDRFDEQGTTTAATPNASAASIPSLAVNNLSRTRKYSSPETFFWLPGFKITGTLRA